MVDETVEAEFFFFMWYAIAIISQEMRVIGRETLRTLIFLIIKIRMLMFSFQCIVETDKKFLRHVYAVLVEEQ